MKQASTNEKHVARFTQVALIIGTISLFVNPVVLALFLELEPDGVLYVVTWDVVLLVLLACSIAFVRSKRPRYRRAFFLGLVLSPLLMVGSEMALSQWRIRSVDAWRPQTIEGVYEPDPELGWRPIANARGRHVSEGNFDATYEIDALGRKAIPTTIEEGATLHFFGDSYAFGHGVSNEETALNLLAQNFASQRGFNVANYAVMGYGLEQMMTALLLHREQIRPGDYVIFVPMSFDLTRNMIHKRFLCAFSIRKTTPVGGLRIHTKGRWDIVELDEKCGRLENLFLQSNFAFGLLYHAVRDRMLRHELLANANAIFTEAEELVRDAQAEPVLLFLAAPWECRSGKHEFDLSGLQSRYRSMLQHCPDEDLRFPTDSHWSPAGHRWVARFLAEELDPLIPGQKPLQ